MNKKLIGFGVAALSLASFAIVPTTNAFFGGGEKGMMSQERFEEMREMFLSYDSVEDFHAAMQVRMEAMRQEREAVQGKISREVTKIDNGVKVLISSEDPTQVAKIQKRHARASENAPSFHNISRTVENIENGVVLTITSDDEEVVEQIQSREIRGMEARESRRIKKGKRGEGMDRGQGKRRGHGKHFGGEQE